MNRLTFEGKTKEEAVETALKELNASREEVIINEKKVEKKLFSKKVEIEVITKEELNKEIKRYILFLVNKMGFEANIETKYRDNAYTFDIICDKASILIGKNGHTIDAIFAITNQYINGISKEYYPFYVDVNGYKNKRVLLLEKLAKQTAKTVARTKIEVKLDPMKAYERRVIHNTLSESPDVTTQSFGEEPNRYIVIKPREI